MHVHCLKCCLCAEHSTHLASHLLIAHVTQGVSYNNPDLKLLQFSLPTVKPLPTWWIHGRRHYRPSDIHRASDGLVPLAASRPRTSACCRKQRHRKLRRAEEPGELRQCLSSGPWSIICVSPMILISYIFVFP